MPRRQNRTQQHNENRYQIKRDKQYKEFLGIAQAFSKSLEQSNVFDFDTTSHYTPATSESLLPNSGLRFDTTQKCLLGLLLLTAVGSLIPRANAMPAIDVNDTNSLVPRDRFAPSINATEINPLQLNTQALQDRKKFSNRASQEIGLFRQQRKSVSVVKDSVEKFYCSPQISCSTKSDVKSCNFTSDNPENWDYIGDSGDSSNVVVGSYNFSSATATYHSSTVFHPICIYENIPSNKFLALYGNPLSNLEVYYDATTKWNIAHNWPDCHSGSPQACPLKEAYSLEIFNNNTTEAISVTAHGTAVLQYPIGSNSYAAIRYEDVALGCNSGNQCKIDFSTDSKGIVGSSIVDMDDAMKILQIFSFPANGISTTQVNLFNTLELKKVDNPPAPNASIVIINNINSGIGASANYVRLFDKAIPSRANGSISFDRAVMGCNSNKLCKISIGFGLYTNPEVGAVTVDMSDNMRIIEVDSDKPSEIDIKQVGLSNAVEIDYPNHSIRRR